MSQTAAGQRLRDIALFVRSKNAGPFMLTIDMFFADAKTCERVLASGVLDADSVARLYGIAPASIKVISVPPANALKVSFPRPLPAGEVGDNDVAGGQQFAPMLDLLVPGI